MIVDQLTQVLTSLTLVATLLTFVGFVSLLSFLVHRGLLRRKGDIPSLDALEQGDPNMPRFQRFRNRDADEPSRLPA